jgi:16S rRNA processing protein RimM
MIVLGRIIAPYGVRGWLKVKPFGDAPEAWREMPQWWLGASAEGKDWQPHAIEAFRPHAGGWIVKLAGVDDRTAAEKLEGRFVAAPREALPQTGSSEYYWADLVGLAVVNEKGESLGRVDSLMETGAHAVLAVKEDGNGEAKERLLPFVDKVVKHVDVAGGCIRVAWELDW